MRTTIFWDIGAPPVANGYTQDATPRSSQGQGLAKARQRRALARLRCRRARAAPSGKRELWRAPPPGRRRRRTGGALSAPGASAKAAPSRVRTLPGAAADAGRAVPATARRVVTRRHAVPGTAPAVSRGWPVLRAGRRLAARDHSQGAALPAARRGASPADMRHLRRRSAGRPAAHTCPEVPSHSSQSSSENVGMARRTSQGALYCGTTHADVELPSGRQPNANCIHGTVCVNAGANTRHVAHAASSAACLNHVGRRHQQWLGRQPLLGSCGIEPLPRLNLALKCRSATEWLCHGTLDRKSPIL